MKICFVAHGDIEKVATVKRATGLANPLMDAGHQVGMVIEEAEGNRVRTAVECPDADIMYYRPGSVREEVDQKKQFIEEYDPDVLWVCSIGARQWVTPLLRRKGRIYLIQHSELPSSIRNYSRLKRLRELMLEWSTLFWFDGHLCVSRHLENVFNKRARRALRRTPVLYSPDAYSPHVLLKPGEQTEEIRQRYPGRKIVLYMGTLAANYGIFDMLAAVEKLKATRQDFVLLVLGGSGRHREQAAKHIEDHGLGDMVHMLGYVPEADLASYFQATHTFLSPLRDSIQDKARCPSKLFMYAPFGRPVVTCKIGEAYGLFGDEGWYYEAGNVDGLIAKLNEALDFEGNLPNAERLAQAHSWKARADDFLEWYEQHFSQRRR